MEKDIYLSTNQFALELQPYGIIDGYELFIDLQWFAAEDEGRTFDPTERKIRKAREEGRVAKSQDIPSSLILLSVAALIWGIDNYYVRNFKDLFAFYIQRLNRINELGFSAEMLNAAKYIFQLMWPIVFIVIAIAILGNTIQFGWVFSTKPLEPDFSKVSFKFDKWAEKVFSVQGVYSTSLSVVKIALIVVIILLNLLGKLDEIAASSFQTFDESMKLGFRIIFSILVETGLLLLAIGIIDYQFQRYLFMNQLKMTFQDVKEEFKESEGDPEVKRKIQNRMQEFLSRNVVKNVSDSDVLVTNPTHFAVALKYESETMDAPHVMAKGEDSLALRMRQIAKDAEVPIIENKPLARALYADLEVGDEIPEKYYEAVVIIFEELYKLKEKERV